MEEENVDLGCRGLGPKSLEDEITGRALGGRWKMALKFSLIPLHPNPPARDPARRKRGKVPIDYYY